MKWSHVRRLYEAIEPRLKASPVKLEKPDGGRVLVLAPHIDDDVIGCGGTLAKHAAAGDEVMALYFADCTQPRILEAKAAASIIGIGRLEFLEFGSKQLYGRRREAAQKLKETFEKFRPHTVYLPSLFDRHNDHLAVNHILCGLFGETRLDFTVCSYEVWTPLVPNLVVDVTSTMDKKREAISKYASQLASNDWLDAAVCLNRYRAVVCGAGRYAEVFFMQSMEKYFDLWRDVYPGV
ncbi:MAG: PIG-L family deacetylase [Nitrospiraceae bacterium]|nr:PIG-L family deacetylase [Nitrospiraceae bacterium]